MTNSRIRTLKAQNSEAGGGSPTIIIMLIVLIVGLVGLVVDGGGKYQADQQAAAIAQSAARAGVNSAASPELPTNGPVTIYANQAVASARQYLQAAGVTGDVTINGNTVTVIARKDYKTKLISMIAPTITGVGTGSAELRSGP